MPTLSVMTFNVRGALFDDGLNRWPQRAALNLRTITHHTPDLIGFQELHNPNLAYYQQHLAGYLHVLGPPYNDADPFQYPAIFWREQQLRLVDSGGFWLSLTPDSHSRAWDTACIRSAAWARLEWGATGRRLLHLNTHLDHVGPQARLEGARLILQQLERLAGPEELVMVTGDFNCPPGSEPYCLFLEHGFADAYLAAGHAGPAPTFHGFQGSGYVPRPGDADRIDWVLLRDRTEPTSVVACSVIQDAEPPLYPSDHYPVIATLALD